MIYESLREASKKRGQSRTHLTRKCRDLNHENFQFLEKTSYERVYQNHSMPCQINNCNYLSLSKAAKELKCSPGTIKKRCESPHYSNYKFLNKSERSNDYPKKE